MDNKFISHDTLRKHKVRENETSNQREIRFVKQYETRLQKRIRKNDEEQEACKTRNKERKCIKLAMEMDE